MTSGTVRWLMPVLLVAAGAARAEGLYLGAKAGFMDVNDNDFDEAVNVGAVAGYEFPAMDIVHWALEAEFTTTTSDGDFEVPGANGRWDIDTQALYGAARIGDRFYAKFRFGVLNEDISARAGGFSRSDSDTSFTAGLGGGWRAGERFGVEAEYTQIEEDIGFISLGVHLYF